MAYLGLVLQKMLRGYTEAAVSFTSSLVTFVSRFAVQVCQYINSSNPSSFTFQHCVQLFAHVIFLVLLKLMSDQHRQVCLSFMTI